MNLSCRDCQAGLTAAIGPLALSCTSWDHCFVTGLLSFPLCTVNGIMEGSDKTYFFFSSCERIYSIGPAFCLLFRRLLRYWRGSETPKPFCHWHWILPGQWLCSGCQVFGGCCFGCLWLLVIVIACDSDCFQWVVSGCFWFVVVACDCFFLWRFHTATWQDKKQFSLNIHCLNSLAKGENCSRLCFAMSRWRGWCPSRFRRAPKGFFWCCVLWVSTFKRQTNVLDTERA